MLFFGSVKLVAFVLVFFFKKERNAKKMAIEEERVRMEELYNRIETNTVARAYKSILDLFRVKPMRYLIFVFVTLRIGMSSEGAIRLKLVEAGVSREKISLLGLVLAPLLLIFPFFISKYIRGPRPLDLFIKVYPYR